MARASMENGSLLGVITAATTTMPTMAQRRGVAELRGRDHAGDLEGHQQHRELEADAEDDASSARPA